MIDKVVFVSMNEMVIVYTNRSPFTLRSDTNVLKLYDWFMAPPGWSSLSEYNQAVANADEDTQVIDIAELNEEAA